MSAVKLWDAGYREILPVAPPGAELSERSTLKPEMLGKIPAKLGREGWYGFDWLRAPEPTRSDAERWDVWGANVGILAAHYPALDIDVKSAALAHVVQKLAVEHLGAAPVRRSVEPRRLLVYRTDEPFARMAMIVTHGGKSHLIEFLGQGRQYLLAGTHPSGAQYEIDMPAPDELTTITREQVFGFFDALEKFLHSRKIETERVGSGKVAGPAPVQTDLLAPSVADVRRVVDLIPNRDTDGWDRHVEMGYAIKAACGPDDEAEAFEIWQSWNERWAAGESDADTNGASWRRFHAPYRVGWTWLQEQAERLGDYVPAQDEFEVIEDAPPEQPLQLPSKLNDECVVEWLLPRVADQVRYTPASKVWYVWDGHRWAGDSLLIAQVRVRAWLTRLSQMLHEHADSMPKDEGLVYRRAAESYQQGPRIRSVIELLQARVACKPSDFDLDPMLLNTPGGVVDLRTGAITPGSPEDMHSRSTLVAPRRGRMPQWQRFLEHTTGGDADLQRYLQLMLGYALTGDMGEKSLWYLWGSESDTGKSTLIRTITQLWGSYADSVSPDVFMRSRNDRIPAELARMPGVRLVTATEPEAGRAWDETKTKGITGGDPIEVRFLYGQPFVYAPQFKIVIVGNSEPEIGNVDSAMLRRIRIVPINVPVPREEQIADLSQRMVEEEGPAILAWLIEGALAWQREGLTTPDSVTAKTTEYVDEENTIGQWIREECTFGPHAEATRAELYSAWARWCRSYGETPGGLKGFKRTMVPIVKKYALQDRQVGPVDARRKGYRGIALRAAIENGTEFST